MWLTTGLLGLLLLLFFLFYRQRKQKHSLFRHLNIPGPDPHWLSGNASDLLKNKYEAITGWSKKYGSTFGFYEGPTPILYTANPELLKHVLVKDYSKFYMRKKFPVQPAPDDEYSHMFLAYGKGWKRLRTVINPTFSSAKLKLMSSLVTNKATILAEKFTKAAESDESTDVLSLYQAYTLDVIGVAAFGMEVDSQNNPDDEVLKQCRKHMDTLENSNGFILVASYLPLLSKLAFDMFLLLIKFVKAPAMWMIEKLEEIIELRKEQKIKRMDLLQLMLDAEEEDLASSENLAMTMDDTVQTDSKDQSQNVVASGPVKTKHRLTLKEISSQAFLFLIAGYDTTSNALAYTSYLLALNPDKQQLVHEELDAVLEPGAPITFEQVKKLTYLEMCLSEALRMFPVGATVVDRTCMEECVLEGIHFKPGMVVMANIMDLHMDPELWGPRDPKSFEPERFSAEEKSSRHPVAWIPFGAGPRNCIGLRFAVMEAKIALASVLRSHKLVPCADTEVPMKLRITLTLSPCSGIRLKVVERETKA